jgi:hypothetical protein
MNKLFTILSMLILLFFVGCSIKPIIKFNHNKNASVYIDPDYTWANNYAVGVIHGRRSSLRSITLRVINKKYVDVVVKIRCDFVPENSLSNRVKVDYTNKDANVFGEREKIVEARNDETFLVYGFARLVPDKETVSCYIKSVK